MNNLLSLLLISLFIFSTDNVWAQSSNKPNINIAKPVQQIKKESSQKPLKLKTTILTKSTDELNTEEEVLDIPSDPTTKEPIVSSDVDSLLQNIDVEVPKELNTQKQSRMNKYSSIMKKNFIWFAFFVILFPIILFALLIKIMNIAKKRFSEDKKKGPSKEEKFLDEIERSQKKKKNQTPKSLSEILGQHSMVALEPEDDEIDEIEDDEEGFEVEEVVVEEDNDIKEEMQINNEESNNSVIIDRFVIDDNLEFFLNKTQSVDLFCKLKGQNFLLMQVENSQKFNKVRRIDTKPGRDVYMVKLNNWRGLIEVTEESAKFLMDI